MDQIIENLQNQIWITRASRINAEKRMLRNDRLVQGFNIYYTCITVLMSICLLAWQDRIFSILTTVMSVALLIIVLFFKSLHYPERAFDFRRIYTELQKLEFQLNRDGNDSDLKEIHDRYCQLMAEGENHITFDYFKAICYSGRDFRKEKMTTKMWLGYVWGVIWRHLIVVLVAIIPMFLIGLGFWVKQYGISL